MCGPNTLVNPKAGNPPGPAPLIEIEHQRGVRAFYCPVCGSPVLVENEGILDQLCHHVMLIHDWAGEFISRDEEIQTLVEAAKARAEAKEEGSAIRAAVRSWAQHRIFRIFRAGIRTKAARGCNDRDRPWRCGPNLAL